MIEIVIIILIGKQFFQLAKKYNQKLAWIYGVLGVFSYYGGAFIAGIILGIYIEFTGEDPFAGVSDLILGLIFIPIGAFFCWGTYQLFKKKWHKEYAEEERKKPKISDIGKPGQDFTQTKNDGDWRI
ncbi:hypothetical protein IMCC3317_42990 [Kordia antarctica]|uniref:Uncharacterized protein n=1 Tax=Kordia antarctica TaxID=1218801 RepID=A0A7L4ZQY9_9FLAO|nr:hypothetical protein [Kordia antarctica]QHI38899.1 hypothetical protein IMCC3317_42990 [Kordia antarctica]